MASAVRCEGVRGCVRDDPYPWVIGRRWLREVYSWGSGASTFPVREASTPTGATEGVASVFGSRRRWWCGDVIDEMYYVNCAVLDSQLV